MLRFLNSSPESATARAVEACLRCYSTCMSAGLLPYHGASEAWLDDELCQLLIDTAELCKVTARYLRACNSQVGALCAVCADLCSECARDCRLCTSRLARHCTKVVGRAHRCGRGLTATHQATTVPTHLRCASFELVIFFRARSEQLRFQVLLLGQACCLQPVDPCQFAIGRRDAEFEPKRVRMRQHRWTVLSASLALGFAQLVIVAHICLQQPGWRRAR